jgi:hypothetical protein
MGLAIAFAFRPATRFTSALATKRSPTPCRIRAAADDRNRPIASASGSTYEVHITTCSRALPGKAAMRLERARAFTRQTETRLRIGLAG